MTWERKHYIGTINGNRIVIEVSIKYIDKKKATWDSLTELKKYIVASFVGSIGRNFHGQIDMELKKLLQTNKIEFAKGWNKKRLLNLLSLWDAWHLNDLKAGTLKQIEFLEKKETASYDEQVEALKKANLLVDRDYEYGTKWLLKPLTAKAIHAIKTI